MDNKAKKLISILGVLSATVYGVYKAISNMEPEKYSLEWIRSLSDSQWETEREIVRQMFCSPKYSDSQRTDFQRILFLFDKVKSEREWDGDTPRGPAYHREHGYNLYKPD